MAQVDPLRVRANELYATGRYPNWKAAHQQALREARDVVTRQHREYIDSLPDDRGGEGGTP